MRKVMVGAALGLALATAMGGSTARAATLFTTNSDFTPWTYDGPTISVGVAGDTDGSTTNGIGNTTAPGGTSAAAGVTIAYSGGYRQATSQDESTNTAFLAALGSKGELAMNFSVPASFTPDYLQTEFVFNDSSGFQELGLIQFEGGPGGSSNGTVVNNGGGNYTLLENYTLAQPAAGYSYFKLEVVFNSDATSGPNFTFDDIHTVVPEPTGLVMAVLPLALGLRRPRRQA